MDDALIPAIPDETEDVRDDVPVPVSFQTGRAGTGKTFALLAESQAEGSSIQLCATTGIAAVNLGATTLNSTLGYFDTASLRDSFLRGQLTRRLHELALSRRVLAIDEGSMLEADQLDLIYRGVEEANRYRDVTSPLAIRLVGDFAQLPPVQGRWAFEADCWRHFAAATTRLDKVWRQDGGDFLDALNFARVGDGLSAAALLDAAGAEWHTARDEAFDGTTILPKNALVNRHNALVLAKHPGRVIEVRSRRWGKQRSEWGENSRTHEWGIPQTSEFKIGAYVMILANSGFTSTVHMLKCRHCGKSLGSNRDAVMRSVRERLSRTVAVGLQHLEGETADTRKEGTQPKEVLQPQLCKLLDDSSQRCVAEGDAWADGEHGGELEGRAVPRDPRMEEPAAGWVRSDIPPTASPRYQGEICSGASAGDGEKVGSTAATNGEGTSPERDQKRQSTEELGTYIAATASFRKDLLPLLSKGILDKVICPHCLSDDVEDRRSDGMEYVNGDCGHVMEIEPDATYVQLIRNGETVRVGRVVRHVEMTTKPDGIDVSAVSEGGYLDRPHTRRRVSPSGRSKIAGYVIGQVERMPLSLAWASTVHKSQGLSLDRIQVDYRDAFFRSPAMLYVALSRCRTLAGLRLVGMREVFVRACKMDERVRNFV